VHSSLKLDLTSRTHYAQLMLTCLR